MNDSERIAKLKQLLEIFSDERMEYFPEVEHRKEVTSGGNIAEDAMILC